VTADVRKPPVDEIMRPHLPVARGKCRWCGKPVTEKTPARGYLKYWHDECEEIYLIAIRPDTARNAVFKRDKGICCDCGEDWSERYILRKGMEVITGPEWDVTRRWTKADNEQYRAERAQGYWRYTELVYVSLWHVDHKVPLWKVRHMPAIKRIVYWMLGNLITRCHRCHQLKSNKETAERTKIKKRERAKKPKRQWPKRKMRSGNAWNKRS
jgi:5-methylcytosine-specific restriction endonuclease McrA